VAHGNELFHVEFSHNSTRDMFLPISIDIKYVGHES